jgi:hypothetical protein
MSGSEKTVMFEKHPCPHCKANILILDREEFPDLTPEEKIMQEALGVIIIKTGDTITCPRCKKTIIVQ